MSTTLTQQRLHELLHYDPSTGAFTWRVAPNRRIIAGSVAGVTETNGTRVEVRAYAKQVLEGDWPAMLRRGTAPARRWPRWSG